jgi:hypothetical protein
MFPRKLADADKDNKDVAAGSPGLTHGFGSAGMLPESIFHIETSSANPGFFRIGPTAF